MNNKIDIRQSGPRDRALIEALYPKAFPDEDLLPVVRKLLAEETIVLSLVAMEGDTLAGHVMFTTCGVVGRPDKVMLLAPLAVAPRYQRQGVGSALVHAGLQHSETIGATQVFVLGDPAYYRRFGFEPDEKVSPPYPMPEEWRGAWQSRTLGDAPPLAGAISVPAPWQDEALWAP